MHDSPETTVIREIELSALKIGVGTYSDGIVAQNYTSHCKHKVLHTTEPLCFKLLRELYRLKGVVTVINKC